MIPKYGHRGMVCGKRVPPKLWFVWGMCLVVTVCGGILLLFQVLLVSQHGRGDVGALNGTLVGMLASGTVFICQLPLCIVVGLGGLLCRQRCIRGRRRGREDLSISLDINPTDPLYYEEEGEVVPEGGNGRWNIAEVTLL